RPCNPNQRCRPRWRHDHHCTNNQIGPVHGGRSDREPGELAALIVRKAISAKEVERLVDPLDVVGLG
ncbi:hypothetical protein ACFO1V_09965, partial [Daeguia caeni]